MMPVAFPNWGERSWLYDKSLQYVLSLEVLYCLPVAPNAVLGTNTRVPLVAVPTPRNRQATYRVVGPPLFRGIDRVEREVPEARVVYGSDSMAIKEEGASILEGRLLLEVDTADPIAISYSGVLELDGGTAQLARRRAVPEQPDKKAKPYTEEDTISGRAFISTRQEVGMPKFRWLIYNQFVGVGRVQALVPSKVEPWLLTMSFDLYLGL